MRFRALAGPGGGAGTALESPRAVPTALGPELSTFGLDEHRRDRTAHVALWIAQILLALVFGVAGAAKLALTANELADLAAWTAAVPEPLLTLIGAAELAAALGLVLPALTGIRPALTPLAAAALAVEMGVAALFHASRGEPRAIALPVVLGAVAAAIAWGRIRTSRIAPRPPPPIDDDTG